MTVETTNIKFVVRHTEYGSDITSGSLQDLADDDLGTRKWSREVVILPFYSHPDDTEGETTPAVYTSIPLRTKSTTRDPDPSFPTAVEVDEITQLAEIAASGDAQAFLAAQEVINWIQRPPEDFIHTIQLALSLGAHLVARRLSIQGLEHYPHHSQLQRYAHVLAPPKVIRSDPTT